MFPAVLRPCPDDIGPVPEHLCSTKLPHHLYLRDKDGSKSAQPIQYVGLNEQPLLRAVSLSEDGNFCIYSLVS